MIKKGILYTFLILLMVGSAFAEDPFSRSFSTPSTLSSDVSVIEDVSDGIHPMMRHSVLKYHVKGVIVSNEGVIAIMSLPGGKDYVMFQGDPIGNDMYVIDEILEDYVVAIKNATGETVSIPVSNPVLANSLSGLN